MKPHLLQDRTALECPNCRAPLQLIEFQTVPPVQVEHCATCHGMFFNPGELEGILDAQGLHEDETGPAAEALPPAEVSWPEEEVIYRPCPDCREIMHRVNFGGRSGVILGRCHVHGSWLNGGDLRRLALWWRVGGREIHRQHLTEHPPKVFSKRLSGAAPVIAPLGVPVSDGGDSGVGGTLLTVLWEAICEFGPDLFF